MNVITKALALWQNRSITVKHRACIGLLVFLTAVVAAAGIAALFFMQVTEKSIEKNTEIRRLILTMDRDMEKARHLHAGFFLYYPRIGLQKAHEEYAQASIRITARVISTSQALREKINDPQIRAAFKESRVDLNLYLSSAKRFADTSIASFELVTRLATPGKGLEDRINQGLKDLKILLMTPEGPVYTVQTAEDLIHQYLIKRKRHLMRSAFNLIFDLRRKIDRFFPDPAQKERIEALVDQIKADADQILDVDVAISSKFQDFILQENAARTASEKLITLAERQVGLGQHKILMTRNLSAAILIAVFFLGLFAAGLIAHVLNVSITRRIVALTRATKQMRNGNLDVAIPETGPDELGYLAKTFNFMAARIKGLVDNLAQEVQDRTLELQQANTDLQMEIRERRQAEESARQNEIFLNRIIDQSPFATWISDSKGTLERVNQALKTTLNLTDDQLIGRYNIFKDPLLERQGLMPRIRSVFEEGLTIHFNCDWDGRDIPEMNFTGSKPVSIQATMFPVFDRSGKLANVVTNWVDLSEKKRIETEKKSLERQLRQSHKMEAIGTLAGGIAHDFNNILGIMLGNAELALDDIPPAHPVRDNLLEIQTAGLRAKDVVRQLLDYSRKADQNQMPQDLGRLVRDSLKLLRSSIPSRVQILDEISSQQLMIRADATQIHQVLINLSANAAHAMEENGGILGIQVQSIHLEKTPGPSQIPPGNYVLLRITDTGTGMYPDTMEKIFDPYYTTKAFGKGTGMGLAVVHGIVKSHHAHIFVESRIHQGSRFSIYFPGLDEGKEKTLSAKATPVPLRGSGHILLVDDEKSLVHMMTRMLERLGYRVTGFTDPTQALAAVEISPDAFDLVITDMTMPRMDGLELTGRLKRLCPGLPVFICTGHDPGVDRLGECKGAVVITKPVTMAVISEKLRDVRQKSSKT